MLVISAFMDAEQPRNDCRECAELRQELQALREQVAKLTAALEEERRRGKRQAAPFSKGPPVTEPKPPGRKSGKRHGPHAHRGVPPRIDETYDAPLPQTCPHCASQQVSETHVAVQYQTEIPRTVIYRRFDVHVGTCDDCGRTVAGRHALQTSSARGAAASQLGPQVHALLAILNKELGLSHGKSVKLLRTLFPELHVARATSVRSMLRTSERCAPAYEQLRIDLRDASEVAPDETGWRVGGRLAWLHAFVSQRATCYVIDPTRSHQPAEQLLGRDWSGTLVHDGWSVYDRFARRCINNACGICSDVARNYWKRRRAAPCACRVRRWRLSTAPLRCVELGVAIASAATTWPCRAWAWRVNWNSWPQAASRTNRIAAWPSTFSSTPCTGSGS